MSPERDPFEAAYRRLAGARVALHPGGATATPAEPAPPSGGRASRLLPRLSALPPGGAQPPGRP